MSDIVSGPLKEGIGHVSTDLVQRSLPGIVSTEVIPEQGTVIFDPVRDNVGTPNLTSLIERGEIERQVRLTDVRMLLGKIIRRKAVQQAKILDEIYYRGQAKAFGFQLPLDPKRANGVAYPVPENLRREDFKSNEEYEAARSDQADALSSQEKNSLQGVPLN